MSSCYVQGAVLIAVLCVAGAGYIIPEPVVEVFNPKGLRVSIPDESGIEKFSFYGSTSHPVRNTDDWDFYAVVPSAENGRWFYWNSDLKMNTGDTLHYLILVQKNGITYRKENGKNSVAQTITVQDVNSYPTFEECEQDGFGAFQIPMGAGWDVPLSHASQTNGGAAKRTMFQSSYSSHQSSNSKPVTRSSSQTVSGTYVIKPGGVEGQGVKTSSQFDSTRPDGQQWQHSKADLSADELLKQPLFGTGDLSSLLKGDLHRVNPLTNSAYSQSSYYKKVSSTDHGTHVVPPVVPQYQQSYFDSSSQTKTSAPVAYSQGSYYEQTNRQLPTPDSSVRESYHGSSSTSTSQRVGQKVAIPIQVPVVNRYQEEQTSRHEIIPETPNIQSYRKERFDHAKIGSAPVPFYPSGRGDQPKTDNRVPDSRRTYDTPVAPEKSCRSLEYDLDIRSLEEHGTVSVSAFRSVVTELTTLMCSYTRDIQELQRVTDYLRETNEVVIQRLDTVESEYRALQDRCVNCRSY